MDAGKLLKISRLLREISVVAYGMAVLASSAKYRSRKGLGFGLKLHVDADELGNSP